MLSDVMEDYLKAIYLLQRDAATGTTSGDPPSEAPVRAERVSTSAIAERMEVTPPTVTSMLDKLEERSLVEREKYKGVRLTREGETVAIEVIRHHRLIEAYLAEALDYEWTDVHEEADRLEHHISERFEARIAEALGDPTVDPHGDPIPGTDLAPPEDVPGHRLDECEVGDRVVVQRVRHRTDEELRYLAEAGVAPGTELEVAEIAPFGMVTVTGETGRQSLPAEVARQIRVAGVAVTRE
ncbi:metal-dependent transcriptional regulator [Halomarina ordinaria]|uniref:Metal-dependent transcriptional regulator n=1 Tax=Halomarina ordinaria TaxID=3033939 RepID=A0ABD5UAP1_9EURY|nr:metal-dependent transcriptional regulator [Halomarina sp. PSRA2]